jgi:periplasmic divalent cation tolerance protein
MKIAYITCRDRKEAEKISAHLLKKRLIACANIFPIRSMYRWEGKIAKGNESAIIAKTNSKNFKKVLGEVKKLHSYSIPCVLRIDATANRDYGAWAEKEIN